MPCVLISSCLALVEMHRKHNQNSSRRGADDCGDSTEDNCVGQVCDVDAEDGPGVEATYWDRRDHCIRGPRTDIKKAVAPLVTATAPLLAKSCVLHFRNFLLLKAVILPNKPYI